MKLVNREAERARIVEAISSPPQLVILRGRRRIGKSYLLAHCLEGARAAFVQADERHETTHVEMVGRELSRLLPGEAPVKLGGWDEALELAGKLATPEEPLVLTLDEFQWMLRAQPSLDSMLQRHWDAWARVGTPITVILSGSALKEMDLLLDPDRPLYGRADYRPLLGPLDYRDAASFGPDDASAEERLRRFAVLGGTPQYQAWAGPGPLEEVIHRRILTRGEPLYEEPFHLLRAEEDIRDPGTYYSIIAAIATGSTRLSEISSAAGVVQPNATKMLGRLEELGYIEARAPIGARGPEPKRTRYRIADPFFRFWFRFVLPNRGVLERGRTAEVLERIERELDTFMGPAFEECCRQWLGRYAPPEAWPRLSHLGGWWSRRGVADIDVVGADAGRITLVGSCKWSTRLGTPAIEQLLGAREQLPKADEAKLAVLARGFDPAAERRASEAGVELVTAERLFAD